MTGAQAREAMRAAQAIYTRDCDLAEVAAVTGWETWVGVGGVLYARLPRSTPPRVVRAATADELAAKVREYHGGTA